MKNGLALWAMVLFLPSLTFRQSSALPLTQRIALPNVDGRMDDMGIDIVGKRLFAAAFDNHTLSVHGNFHQQMRDYESQLISAYGPRTPHLRGAVFRIKLVNLAS